MRTLLIAVAALPLCGPAHAGDAFSNEVQCEDDLAPWSAYGTPSYDRGQRYCLDKYDQDRETDRRLKALEDRDTD